MRTRRGRRSAVLVAASLLVAACADEDQDAVLEPGDPPVDDSGGVDGAAPTLPVDDAGDAVALPPPDAVPEDQRPAADGGRAVVPGFGEVAVEVQAIDGAVLEWCLLLAASAEQRARGLMGVEDPDLGGYDGMLFRYDTPSDGAFYMRNTPQELEIAYLDELGAPVSIIRMEPCDDVPGCPSYPAGAPFLSTVEVPTSQGGVGSLGITDGAAVTDTGRRCAPVEGG